MRRKLSRTVVAAIDASKILGVRAGSRSAHRFIGIWPVVIGGRVFGRSWSLKPDGWYRTFLEDPRGALQVGSREIPVRALPVRSERIRDAVERAYAVKYPTPGSVRFVRGFRTKRRREATMEFVPREIGPYSGGVQPHARWVRISHGIVTVSLLTLAFTGFVILMAHPRLYWGEAGNDLTPALIELPISRNYKHAGWEKPTVFENAAGPISASRTFDIFNQNGWGRSLHFLAAWCLVLPGAIYLLGGLAGGHFRAHIWPKPNDLAPRLIWHDVVDHLRLRISARHRRAAIRLAATMRVFAGGVLGGAARRGDRLDDVAGGHGCLAVPAAPLRRLPVGAHDPFLRLRRPGGVRARAHRDGRQVRIPASDPGDDRRGMT